MSDKPDSSMSPFTAFSAAPGFDMFEKMWRMMQVPGLGGTPSPSSMMSDMMAPMTNIDELDKRITDMRAVEQWLKLNLNLLQSAIQALEVQRATLATLKAFGAFAQSSMEQAAAGAPDLPKTFSKPAEPAAASTTAGAAAEASADPLPGIDPTPWWNLLQTQFNQIAALALAAQPAASDTASGTANDKPASQPAAAKSAPRPASASKTPPRAAARTTGQAKPRAAATRKPRSPSAKS